MTRVVKIKWNQAALNDGTIFEYDGGSKGVCRVVHEIKGFAVVEDNGKIKKSDNGQFEVYKSKALASKVADHYNQNDK